MALTPEQQVAFEDRVTRVMDRFENKIDHLAEQVREIREAQIRLEAAGHGELHEKMEAKMAVIEAEIDLLKAQNSKNSGIFLAFEWAYKLGPWIVATALAVLAYWQGFLGG